MMKEFGMIHVYTGTGKGKTTAAIGLAVRAIGHGAKVTMISFMKDDPEYGEAKAYKYLPGFTLKQMGRDCFVNFRDPDPVDVKMAHEAWDEAKRIIKEEETDLLILDELNLAMAKDIVPTADVLKFLKENRNHTEIVFTGREAPAELIEMADLVTDMQEVKHYYMQGVPIRNGIDH